MNKLVIAAALALLFIAPGCSQLQSLTGGGPQAASSTGDTPGAYAADIGNIDGYDPDPRVHGDIKRDLPANAN